MKLVVFGLSLGSSWGNGHATTYRALLSAFARRGHEVAFYEWDAPWYRGERRDLPDPDFCRLDLYGSWDAVRTRALAEAGEADAVLVGSYVHEGPRLIDDLGSAVAGPLFFYDIDTPVTVTALRAGTCAYLRADQVGGFDRYLSFTGGPFLSAVVEGELGARDARPLYCSVDAERYLPAHPDARYRADLAYLGTYAPDRQPGLERYLLEPAARRPDAAFLVAGPQYPDPATWPSAVRHIEHVAPPDHPAFYTSARWQLNLTRADMTRAGWSPSVRLFEAAACGAPLLSDRWEGIEAFFEPGTEIVLPEGADEVLDILADTHDDDRRAIGRAARRRVLAEHTSDRRAADFEALLSLRPPDASAAAPPGGPTPATPG